MANGKKDNNPSAGAGSGGQQSNKGGDNKGHGKDDSNGTITIKVTFEVSGIGTPVQPGTK